MTTTRSAAKRIGGGVLMLAGVALIGYGSHYVIRNGNCSSTGYVQYGPVPKCSGAEGLYITSVFFLGPALALVGWLLARTWGWLWPLVCVSLAAGLATIKIDSTAASGAKSFGLILGVCFGALAVLSVTLTVRKRLRPKPPTLPSAGTARAGPALLDTGPGAAPAASGSFAPYQPVADAARSAGPPSEDPLDRLAKLAQLRDSGALTEAEFDSQKAKILSQM
jgi:Short C-terminal domain